MTDMFALKSSAVFSECGLFRHRLDREVQATGLVILYSGINGSTAGVSEEDQTSMKWRGFTLSQYRGVCWVKRDHAWAARISDGASGKISLGNFQDEETAARAYDKAARDLHGEFAVLNFKEGL
jgi:hypothetical protein